MKKKTWFAAPLLAATLLLAACGGDDSSSTDGEGIIKVVAGTEATYAPFEYMDDQGEIQGYDKEILEAIGEEMGFELEMRNVGWEPTFSLLTTGELDVGAAAITITDERKENYDFTDPYYAAKLLIVVKEDSTIETFDELKDKKVSVQITTTGHLAMQDLQGKASSDILAYENLPIAIQEVINGTTEAAIGDNAVVLEYIKNNPDAGLKVIEDDSFDVDYLGFMVEKGNDELLDVLNEGLQKIKDNGKLAEITGTELE